MTYQIKKYRKNIAEIDKLNLCGGDLIRLLQTEVEGYLSADINYNMQNSECYIRKYSGEYSLENESIDTIWQIEIVQEEEEYGKMCQSEYDGKPAKYRFKITFKILL